MCYGLIFSPQGLRGTVYVNVMTICLSVSFASSSGMFIHTNIQRTCSSASSKLSVSVWSAVNFSACRDCLSILQHLLGWKYFFGSEFSWPLPQPASRFNLIILRSKALVAGSWCFVFVDWKLNRFKILSSPNATFSLKFVILFSVSSFSPDNDKYYTSIITD